jgi:phospholipid/cholesterol/gamma-HCH transport system permease protein
VSPSRKHRISTPRGPEAGQPFGLDLRAAGEGEAVLTLSGRIDHHDMPRLLAQALEKLEEAVPRTLTLDLGGVLFLDSAGALAVLQLQSWAEKRGVGCRLENVGPREQSIIRMIDAAALTREPIIGERRSHGFLVRLGEGAVHFWQDLGGTLSFIGNLAGATLRSLVHPGAVRWVEVSSHIQKIGVDGLPIITLLSFLMGFIIASMAVTTLKQSSLTFLIGPVVAIGIVQEFGPIITAVVVAGRTGSAFAAEIATMEVHEEIDALTAMGYEPVRFLAVPRVVATLAAVPLLTLYADVVGIVGGLVVALTQLHVTSYSYFTEIPANVSVYSFVVSLLKTLVFAFVIVSIGCHRGFRARGGAEAVGRATTSALVTSIFLIIVTDFTFAALVPYLG